MGAVREAIASKRRLRFSYVDKGASASARTARPLGVAFWGKVFSLAAWCELRKDFRSFRLDRMQQVQLGEAFDEEPGKGLDDFIRHVVKEGEPPRST